MNQETTERSRRRSRPVPLKNLYLDPNNFRFVDHPDYREVPDERVFDDEVQRRTTRLLLGRHRADVRDLKDSILENGWIEMEPILVQRRETGRYLVVEGNRRIATLKHLQRRCEEDAIDLRRLDPGVFSRVRVALFEDADDRQRMVMMGLHHVSRRRSAAGRDAQSRRAVSWTPPFRAARWSRAKSTRPSTPARRGSAGSLCGPGSSIPRAP